MHNNAKKDNNIKDTPEIKIFLADIFLYEWAYAIRTATRDMSPQKRKNTGEAYPMLREKMFRENIIKIIEANFRIAMMVPFGDAIMNLSSTIHSIVNINLPARIWQLMGRTIMGEGH